MQKTVRDMTDMAWRASWLWNMAFWYGVKWEQKYHAVDYETRGERMTRAKRRHIRQAFGEKVVGCKHSFWHRLKRKIQGEGR